MRVSFVSRIVDKFVAFVAVPRQYGARPVLSLCSCVALCIFLCCSMYFCVLCIVCFVTFPVLFVCRCVLNNCHRVATQLQLNISYHIISYHLWNDTDRYKPKYLDKRGHAVAQLVEALRYKPEGRGFVSLWCHWNSSFTLSFRPHYGSGVHSASNRNEYQEYFLGVKAAST